MPMREHGYKGFVSVATRLSRILSMCLVLLALATAAAVASNGSATNASIAGPIDQGVARIGASGVELHDTIWELPLRATPAEADTYFAYLESRGYDGAWMSLFSGPAASTFATNRSGNVLASVNGSGDFVLNSSYISNTRAILDKATAHGIDVYMVAIWGVAYIHDNSAGYCAGLNDGPLHAGNAENLGEQIASGLANHPAVKAWVYGGDNWCPPGLAAEDVNIWRNLDAGMVTGGATQPVGYHSPNGADLRYKDESWLDFHAMQTAHCTIDGALSSRFQNAVAGSSKPVWAAEMRYEGIAPNFCTASQVAAGAASPGNPVDANDVLQDSTEAFNAGVAGIVYGHNERWQWSTGAHGSSGTLWQGVQDSFNAPGENLTISLLENGTPPPTTTVVTNTAPSVSLPNPAVAGVLTGATVGFNAAATDPNETLVSSQITWRIEAVKNGVATVLTTSLTGASINYTIPTVQGVAPPYTLKATVTATDSGSLTSSATVSVPVALPSNDVGVGYSTADAASVQFAADYLGMSAAELQKAGIFVARFLTAIGGRMDDPQPIAAAHLPSTTGPTTFVSSWEDDELEVLEWMKSYFAVNDPQAHKVGAALLTFLVGLDAGS
jgi:hypothetical protein